MNKFLDDYADMISVCVLLLTFASLFVIVVVLKKFLTFWTFCTGVLTLFLTILDLSRSTTVQIVICKYIISEWGLFLLGIGFMLRRHCAKVDGHSDGVRNVANQPTETTPLLHGGDIPVTMTIADAQSELLVEQPEEQEEENTAMDVFMPSIQCDSTHAIQPMQVPIEVDETHAIQPMRVQIEMNPLRPEDYPHRSEPRINIVKMGVLEELDLIGSGRMSHDGSCFVFRKKHIRNLNEDELTLLETQVLTHCEVDCYQVGDRFIITSVFVDKSSLIDWTFLLTDEQIDQAQHSHTDEDDASCN